MGRQKESNMTIDDVIVKPLRGPVKNVTVVEDGKAYGFRWNANVKLTKTALKAKLDAAKAKAAPKEEDVQLAADIKTKLG